MRWTYLRRVTAAVVVVQAAIGGPPATAAGEPPSRVESTLTKADRVTLYKDADLTVDAGVFPVAGLFPTDVLDETALGAVHIRVKGADYWADGEKLRIVRPVGAKCLTMSRQVATAADRGANEPCASQAAANTAAGAKKKP